MKKIIAIAMVLMLIFASDLGSGRGLRSPLTALLGFFGGTLFDILRSIVNFDESTGCVILSVDFDLMRELYESHQYALMT